MPIVSICQGCTSWSIDMPKLCGGGLFCNADTFHILNCNGFALNLEPCHVIQGAGDRNVWKEGREWRDSVQEGRIHMRDASLVCSSVCCDPWLLAWALFWH